MNKKYNIIYADLLGITAIPKILMVNFGGDGRQAL